MLAAFLFCTVGGALVYALTKGLGPASTASTVPIRVSEGEWVLTESYWLVGILQLSFFFIGFGFYWAVHDLPEGRTTWWIGIPCYVIAAVGLGRLFFRRRHHFYPKDRRVVVEGFSLWRGSFTKALNYDAVVSRIERRRIGKTQRYCCMFVYPDLEIAFAMSIDEQGARDRMRSLSAILEVSQTPNKALEPTTMAVTPRAPSSTSRASHGRGSS